MSQDPLLARWPEAERIVDNVLDLPPVERRQRAREGCAADLDLWHVVERLLDEADRDEPLAPVPIDAGDFPEESDTTPDRIGPYRVLGQLGRGGMGWVFRAVRDDSAAAPPVAVKLLDVRARSREATVRFARERETLARLQHPNIARLLDGGVGDDGTPYLVMELIEGESIDTYCRHRLMDLSSRLDLFLQVCRAVEFAHARLVPTIRATGPLTRCGSSCWTRIRIPPARRC